MNLQVNSPFWKNYIPEKSCICTPFCNSIYSFFAGNSWGVDPDTGEEGVGLGPQEQFYGCADVRITGGSGSTTPQQAPQHTLPLEPSVQQHILPLEHCAQQHTLPLEPSVQQYTLPLKHSAQQHTQPPQQDLPQHSVQHDVPQQRSVQQDQQLPAVPTVYQPSLTKVIFCYSCYKTSGLNTSFTFSMH